MVQWLESRSNFEGLYLVGWVEPRHAQDPFKCGRPQGVGQVLVRNPLRDRFEGSSVIFGLGRGPWPALARVWFLVSNLLAFSITICSIVGGSTNSSARMHSSKPFTKTAIRTPSFTYSNCRDNSSNCSQCSATLPSCLMEKIVAGEPWFAPPQIENAYRILVQSMC